MSTKVWTNLPPGATHIGPTNVFYMQYRLPAEERHGVQLRPERDCWQRWDDYHKAWIHHEGITLVEEL